MRVIAGKYRSRMLKTVENNRTRPTTDKNKENLFNMIGPYFDGGNCLDLFAGSGGLGIEALSRGMAYLVAVDKQYAAFKVIKENLATLKIDDAKVLKMDYRKALSTLAHEDMQFDLVLLDPPYDMKINQGIMNTLYQQHMLKEGSLIVVEDRLEERLTFEQPFELVKENQYGITIMQIVRFGGYDHD